MDDLNPEGGLQSVDNSDSDVSLHESDCKKWTFEVPDGYDNTNRAFMQALMAQGEMTFEEGQHVIAAIWNAAEAAAQSGDRGDGAEGGDRGTHSGNITVNDEEEEEQGQHEHAGSDEDQADQSEDETAFASHNWVPQLYTIEDVDEDDFNHYIAMARAVLSPLDYDIRSCIDQYEGHRIWAIVNVESDPQTQLATSYSASEVAYICRLLDAMFEARNSPEKEIMAVDEAQALKARHSERRNGPQSQNMGMVPEDVAQPLTHSEVLDILESLVEEGWLDLSKAGFYTLSPRSLMELRDWLIERYNDDKATCWQNIKHCEACKEIVTIGQRCANMDCFVRLHNVCEPAFWISRARGREKKCPDCATPWDGRHYVGEQAVTSGTSYKNHGSRRRELEEAMTKREELEDAYVDVHDSGDDIE